MTEIALRPYLPTDARRCLQIFVTSIAEIACEDYNEDQCDAWIAAFDDEKAMGKRLAAMLTLVATVDGEPVGFISLKGADGVEMIYVAPERARQGVATTLLDAVTRIAAARGASKLTADVSDTAKPLFEKQGFVGQRRNLVTLGEQWLANTTMSKTLPIAPAPAVSTRH